MIYKAVEVIWIFLAGGRTDGRADIEGTIKGPRGPNNFDDSGESGDIGEFGD